MSNIEQHVSKNVLCACTFMDLCLRNVPVLLSGIVHTLSHVDTVTHMLLQIYLKTLLPHTYASVKGLGHMLLNLLSNVSVRV